jgi:hypothetical protein
MFKKFLEELNTKKERNTVTLSQIERKPGQQGKEKFKK